MLFASFTPRFVVRKEGGEFVAEERRQPQRRGMGKRAYFEGSCRI